MGGIRLDWDIESEQRETHSDQRDPDDVKQRRRNRLRFLVILTVVALVIVGIGALIIHRLNQADAYIESALRDTVEAEYAALRVGNWNDFSTIQRSATEDWMQTQFNSFNAYQDLKLNSNVELTGTVRNVAIEGQRARVAVEEIIDGAPYTQIWFYWRYEDGWHHVPPDYTFWGTDSEYQGLAVTVFYQDVDSQLARDLGVGVEGWINSVCGPVLQCGDLPHVRIQIIPDERYLTPDWNPENPWELIIGSPYIKRARSDQPFSGALLLDVASTMARRLVVESSLQRDQPVYPTDAYYIRPAVISWLTGRFSGLNTNSYLITSIAENYGLAKIGEVLQALPSDGSIAVLNQVLGTPSLANANVDWRDYLAWRIRLENELRDRADMENYMRLYTPELQADAMVRFGGAPLYAGTPEVLHIEKSLADDGVAQLVATVRYEPTEDAFTEQITFRLVDDVWKRAS